MNTVNLVGRICTDIKIGGTETKVAKFKVAVDRPMKKNEADFIPVTAFGKQAEVINQYFVKGRQIGITGHIQTGTYEKDGKTNYTTDVILERFDFCGSASDKTSDRTSETSDSTNIVPEGFSALGEDIPF